MFILIYTEIIKCAQNKRITSWLKGATDAYLNSLLEETHTNFIY